jgi:sugar phosphate isomerase/epimerase
MSKYPIGAFIIADKDFDKRLDAAQKIGIPTAHMLAPTTEERTSQHISIIKEKLAKSNVKITCVFCSFEGESYADIPTVEETVGLVPLMERYPRLDEAKSISDFAQVLKVDVIALHLGFIPENSDDPGYLSIVEVTRDLCDFCAGNGQRLHLETGQEPAEVLLKFIKDVDRENLAVNFDPANMILYGSGGPLPAVKLLASHIKSVHCKDAKWAKNPGKEWGEEVLLGEGDVDIKAFLSTLKEIGYVGPLTIEREISGEQQIKDIEKSVALLETHRKEIWGE